MYLHQALHSFINILAANFNFNPNPFHIPISNQSPAGASAKASTQIFSILFCSSSQSGVKKKGISNENENVKRWKVKNFIYKHTTHSAMCVCVCMLNLLLPLSCEQIYVHESSYVHNYITIYLRKILQFFFISGKMFGKKRKSIMKMKMKTENNIY